MNRRHPKTRAAQIARVNRAIAHIIAAHNRRLPELVRAVCSRMSP